MTLTTKYLIQESGQTFNSKEEYLEAVAERPLDQPFWYKHLQTEPPGWSNDHYGIFPPSGLAIVQTQLPSGNRSFTDKQSFKLVTLAITRERINRFGLEGCFSRIFSWGCRTRTSRTPDLCSRICKYFSYIMSKNGNR